MKLLMCKSKNTLMQTCKLTKLLEEPILLQLLVEPDQRSMVFQLSMINQTFRIVSVLENSYHGHGHRKVFSRGGH